MFGSIAKSLVNTATEFAENATDAASAMGSIVGSWTSGDEIRREDVVRLAKGGFTVVEIASFFGVAQRVIEDLLKDNQS